MSSSRLGHVWKLSFPLMLSQLSMTTMMFIDRLFLAQYSPQAFSAAVSAGTVAWAFVFGLSQLCGISTVFVAQYNGAKQYTRIAEPVWQMLWLSVLMAPFVAFTGLHLGPVLFAGSSIEAEQELYFRWMLYICPLFNMLGASNGFFLGRERSQIIVWLSLTGNLVNLVLDPLLIFGWGPIPSMGIVGACIATGIGIAVQILIQACIFLSPKSRQTYGSGSYQLKWSVLFRCARVGAPDGMAVGFELGLWGLFYCIMSSLSVVHILVASIAQTIVLLFIWFAVGLEQGVGAIGGNLIGEGRQDKIPELMRSGGMISLLFGGGLAVLLWLFGDGIIELFLQNPEGLEGVEAAGRLTAEEISLARSISQYGLFGVWLYLLLDTMRMTVAGVLRAAGDTLYILLATSLTMLLFQVLPTYILMVQWGMSVTTLFPIWSVFSVIALAALYARFAMGGWRQRSLLTPA